MLRLTATAVIALIADAVALLVSAAILEGVTIDARSFVIAVVVFTGVSVVTEAVIRQAAFKNASVLLGSTSLIATLVSLVITALISSGLSISGFTDWVLATVLVWAIGLGMRLVLPLVIFKKTLAKRQART